VHGREDAALPALQHARPVKRAWLERASSPLRLDGRQADLVSARCYERLKFPADAQAQGRGAAGCLFRAGAATCHMQTGRTAGSASMHFVRGDREQGSGESLTARQSAVSQLRTMGRRGNCRVAALG